MEKLTIKTFREDLHLQWAGKLTEMLLGTNSEMVLQRLRSGEGYLAFLGEQLIGTVTLYPPQKDSVCTFYQREGVFSFGQFGIHRLFQGKGYGSRLIQFVEERASNLGAVELALDTPEKDVNVIKTYSKRGYQLVDNVQWGNTNERNVVMSKRLA